MKGTLQNSPRYFKRNCYSKCDIERCRELQRYLQQEFDFSEEPFLFDRKEVDNAIEELRKIKSACDTLNDIEVQL